MDFQLKQRLVGAAVLVSLAVIFLPMLLDEPQYRQTEIEENPIPPKPEEFHSPVRPMKKPLEADGKPLAGSTNLDPAPVQSPKQHAAPQGNLKPWVIQVGSFSSEKNAKALRDKLRSKGFTAFVERTSGEDQALYRVRVGPELDLKRVNAMREELEKSLKLKALVIRER